MSLKDEREYELFSTKLTYDVEGTSVGEHPIPCSCPGRISSITSPASREL